MDLVEISDLVLKFCLLKIYGNNANPLMMGTIVLLLDSYFIHLSKTRYLLTEIE